MWYIETKSFRPVLMQTKAHRTLFTSYMPQYKLAKYKHIINRNVLLLLCVNYLWCVDVGTMCVYTSCSEYSSNQFEFECAAGLRVRLHEAAHPTRKNLRVPFFSLKLTILSFFLSSVQRIRTRILAICKMACACADCVSRALACKFSLRRYRASNIED